ncbi:MAG: hypothetical protein IJ933_09740 [Bacteroidales bacterium]|jgi:hypothetical protein|nr:hypothetical protein [Bacteroidales bacterium]
MDKSLEELRLLIASCAESGQISKSDMEMLTVRARIMGLSPEELDALIQTSGQKSVDGMESMDGNFFAPKAVHIVVAVVLVVVVAVLVFVGLDFNGSGGSKNSAYLGLGDKEISESDLYHLYSGSYEGKSLLLTVKDVRNENNKYVMIFDFKCDFVPVAQNCKCYVDLQKHTYEFEDMAAAKKIPLGSGTISRSATGKVVFRPSSGLYELLQL